MIFRGYGSKPYCIRNLNPFSNRKRSAPVNIIFPNNWTCHFQNSSNCSEKHTHPCQHCKPHCTVLRKGVPSRDSPYKYVTRVIIGWAKYDVTRGSATRKPDLKTVLYPRKWSKHHCQLTMVAWCMWMYVLFDVCVCGAILLALLNLFSRDVILSSTRWLVVAVCVLSALICPYS